MTRAISKQRGSYDAGEVSSARLPDPSISKAGMTLVEIMVAMALSLIVIGSAYMAFNAHNKTSNEQNRVAMLQQDARAVLDMIDRDIRNSGSNSRRINLIAFHPEECSASSIGMHMDLTWDADAADTGEDVRYWLNGTTLEYATPVATTALLENVTQFQIVYLNRFGQAIAFDGPGGTLSTTNAAQILSVLVTLSVRSSERDADSGQYIVKTVSRQVQSRNREITHKSM